jgi:hypothetical protein
MRVWFISDRKLLRTIRVPTGSGNIGKINAVAMSPDGSFVAAAGWTGQYGNHAIYLFDRETGGMVARIPGLEELVLRLISSPCGRYLAATLEGAEGCKSSIGQELVGNLSRYGIRR